MNFPNFSAGLRFHFIHHFFQLYKLKISFKNIFNIFAQNIDCGYSPLCFGAKIRKIDVSLHTPVLLYKKVGFEGVYITQTCFF